MGRALLPGASGGACSYQHQRLVRQQVGQQRGCVGEGVAAVEQHHAPVSAVIDSLHIGAKLLQVRQVGMLGKAVKGRSADQIYPAEGIYEFRIFSGASAVMVEPALAPMVPPVPITRIFVSS